MILTSRRRPAVRRVIFVVEAPLSTRDFDRFGIGHLRDAGFEIVVVDVSSVLQPHMRAVLRPDLEERIDVRRIDRVATAARLVRALLGPDTIFVYLLGYRAATLSLFQAVGSGHGRYALWALTTVPRMETVASPGRRMFSGLMRTPRAWLDSIVYRIPARLCGVRSAEVVVMAGTRSLAAGNARTTGRDTTRLFAGALDYDLFLDAADSGRGGSRNDIATIVFLDQFLESHPDREHFAVPFCDPRTYYSNLRRVFDAAESELGARVVVAAHPRSDYKSGDTRFGGREIIAGRTVDLVRDATLVLTHDSTAIGFAVLFERPVCFITDDGIRKNDARRANAETLSRLLGKPIHNLDHDSPIDWKSECVIDRGRYEEYRESYLKRSASPRAYSWQIFAEYLKGNADELS